MQGARRALRRAEIARLHRLVIRGDNNPSISAIPP
jgi:hypothetical protein